jgi:glycerol transport system ATP-binding protein
MARIDLVDLAHSYSGNAAPLESFALKPVTMTWRQGGAYALLGPSGCGKTTLLNLISGIVAPSRGKILFDRKDITPLSTQKRNIAQVFQFPVIYDTMSVGQNLAFPLKNRGVERGEIDKRVREIADLLDLTPYLNRKATRLTADGQAKDLARPRPGALRRRRRAVRRTAHGDRSRIEMAAALEAEGAAPRA